MNPYISGTPVESVRVTPKPTAPVPVRVGALVQYHGGRYPRYYGATLEVSDIRESPVSLMVYLKRPGSHPRRGYAIAVQPHEVWAVEA